MLTLGSIVYWNRGGFLEGLLYSVPTGDNLEPDAKVRVVASHKRLLLDDLLVVTRSYALRCRAPQSLFAKKPLSKIFKG